MARLGIGEESDQLFLELFALPQPPARWVRMAPGFDFVEDEDGALVAIRIQKLSQRGGLQVRIYADGPLDCLYIDVAGERQPVRASEAAAGVWIYVDGAGDLAGIELIDLKSRGGLAADPIDGEQPRLRAAWYDEIEAAARRQSTARPAQRPGAG